MEFMDRRKRSLLVQFWLTVESFKNPLESVDSGSDNDDDDPIRDPSLTDTLREDILMMNELYFSGPATDPALSVISLANAFSFSFINFAFSSDQPCLRFSISARCCETASPSCLFYHAHRPCSLHQVLVIKVWLYPFQTSHNSESSSKTLTWGSRKRPPA